MDSAMIELSGAIDMVEGYLPDMAGAPMVMRISPDMLPVMVASVDYDGMDVHAISAFATEHLDAEFERIDGVASVDATGLVTETVTVSLDADKIAALNEKVKAGVDAKMADASKKIADGRAELADGKAKLTSGKTELANQKNAIYAELAAGSAQLNGILSQLSSLNAQQQTLTAAKAALEAAIESFLTENEQIAAIADAIAQMGAAFPGTIEEILAMTEEEFLALRDQVAAQLLPTDPELAMLVAGIDYDTLLQMKASYDAAQAGIGELESQLGELSGTIEQLQTGYQQAQDAYIQLESGK